MLFCIVNTGLACSPSPDDGSEQGSSGTIIPDNWVCMVCYYKTLLLGSVCKDWLEIVQATFDACDSNGDKGLTLAEVKACEVGIMFCLDVCKVFFDIYPVWSHRGSIQ